MHYCFRRFCRFEGFSGFRNSNLTDLLAKINMENIDDKIGQIPTQLSMKSSSDYQNNLAELACLIRKKHDKSVSMDLGRKKVQCSL